MFFKKNHKHLRKAAIFDLDGTLIPTTSAEKNFFFHLFCHGGLSICDILKMSRGFFRLHGNFHAMVRENKQYLRGKSAVTMNTIAHSYFEPQINSLIFPVMRPILEAHRVAGDMLLLLTGTLDFIARSFVTSLKMDGYRATKLDITHGIFTGKIIGTQPYGIGKLEVLRDLRKEFNFDQNRTTLYANLYSDRYVLNAVDEPVAVNPDKALRKYASRKNWRIIDV